MIRNIANVQELEELFGRYNSGYLFRGQNRHYTLADGGISISTSFQRNGCIPPLMQKWMLYAEEILIYLKGPEFKGRVDLIESQAVLQHYGWRSFYLDFTRDIQVACWFASNVYSEKQVAGVVEDWQEIGLWSSHKTASYAEHNGYGYLYVVKESNLEEHQIQSSELERFRFSDFSSRFDRQSAVMVGPLSLLPESLIEATYCVPVEVLREYSKTLTMEHLFPGREEDFVYRLLLAPPFVQKNPANGLGNFGPYIRDLDIPEYDYAFIKRPSPNVAFYQRGYLLDLSGIDSVVVRIPDSFLHHVDIEADNNIREVLRLFPNADTLIMETEGLLRWPVDHSNSIYLKGVVIKRKATDEIFVAALIIYHPGASCNPPGEDSGWHYRVIEDCLERNNSVEDCPCNNFRKHKLQLTAIKKLERAIIEGRLRSEKGKYIVSE